MRSRLYVGEVMHRRTRPVDYQFRYGVFYCGVDLAEIEELDRRMSLLSYNAPNVVSLQDRDHVDSGSLRDVEKRMGPAEQGETTSLLTNARIFNYLFNPVSFYLRRSSEGRLSHVLAEVHNTHGQRHVYDLVRADSDPNEYVSGVDKAFYVSPFIQMQGRYTFRFRDVHDGLEIAIEERDEDGLFFEAALKLRAIPFTNANLVKLLLRFPLVTLKTITLIHWQAFKLWLRGVPFNRNPHPRPR